MEWRITDHPVGYHDAVAWMERRAGAIAAGTAPECVWLLEHPALYTAGSSARPQDLRDPQGLPVIATRRGGQYTYHGPGQRVAYVMLNLATRDRDVRAHVARLEAWMIATLAEFQLTGLRRPGRVGVWIDQGDHDDKIAAIGVRVKSWVTLHGVALNVDPNLGHYAGIVPCGITGHGVTSLVALGLPVTLADVDLALRRQFDAIFAIS